MNLSYFFNLFTPKSILDIGCNTGQFYKSCCKIWPSSEYFLIDANENVKDDLDLLGVPYKICVLSDTIKIVDWYESINEPKGTGQSYYRENTKHYVDGNINIIKKETETLDTLFNDKKFDLIKLDTQGSELDIIRGGKSLCSKADYIIIETSIIDYNIGAPKKDEVVNFMREIGFSEVCIADRHIYKGSLSQEDIIFKKMT